MIFKLRLMKPISVFRICTAEEQGETEPDEISQNEVIRKNFALKIVAQKIEPLRKVKVKAEGYSVETDENELKAVNYLNTDSEKGSTNSTQENYFKTDKNEIILKIKKRFIYKRIY